MIEAMAIIEVMTIKEVMIMLGILIILKVIMIILRGDDYVYCFYGHDYNREIMSMYDAMKIKK